MDVIGFFKRPAVRTFLGFTALYALAMGFVFWGTWSLDRAPVEPDNPIVYAADDAAQWFAQLCAGANFVPNDLMHVLGGMYFWQELQYALAGYLAALGVAFYLAGRALPLLAAYGGGAAYGLMGYTFTLYSAGHLGWFVWLMYGPFAFGLVDRAVRLGRWHTWALLGVVLAWAGARQPDMWLLFTLLTFAYGVWCLVRERRALRWGRLFAGTALTAACALACGAPQFGKAIFEDIAGREKQIAESAGKPSGAAAEKGASRDQRWLFCTSWSLPPEDTLEFLVPEIHGGSNDPRVSPKNPYRGRLGQHGVVPPGPGGRHPVTGALLKAGDEYWLPYRQHSLYFGLITLLFAAAGVWTWRRDRAGHRDVPFWLGAAVILYLCALGGFTPFYRLVFALPFGDQIRCPVKFVHLLEFAVAVLAGHGIAGLLARFGANRAWVGYALAALVALNVADLARVDAKYLAVEDVTFQRAENAAARDVVRLGGGPVHVALAREEGGELVKGALGLHGARTTDKPSEARFILAGASAMRRDPTLGERLRSGALSGVGFYALSRQGLVPVPSDKAALALFQVRGVEPPAPAPKPAPRRGAQLLTLLSVLTSLGVPLWALSVFFHSRPGQI